MSRIPNNNRLYPFLIIVLLIGILLAFIGWILKGNTDKRTVLSVIPEDAIFILEIDNFGSAVKEIKQNKIWSYLKEYADYASINNYTHIIDSITEEYPLLLKLLKNRGIGISSHIINGNEYDFLYVLNIGNLSKLGGADKVIRKMIDSEDVSISLDSIEGVKVWKVRSGLDNKIARIAIIDNLGLFSFSEEIITQAIKYRNSAGWDYKVDKKDDIISFYFNYNQLNAFAECFFQEIPDLLEPFANSLNLTKVDAEIYDDFYSFTGVTEVKDSIASYVSALTNIDAGKIICDKIAPSTTAAYLSCSFSSVNNLLEGVLKHYNSTDSIAAISLEKNISSLEKLFKLNINKDILDWVGEEIAIVKLQPQNNIKENDILLIVHSKNIDLARKGIEKIERNVIEDFAKVRNIDYNGFDIKYLNIKGFLKPFFGKGFNSIDKPYYTVIDEYVLFSNSHYYLSKAIDDFLKGQSLLTDKNYKEFKSNFNKKSNFSLFINTPKLYSHLDYFSRDEMRDNLRKNKKSIMSFSELGMQLVADNNAFNTFIAGRHDPDAAFNAEIESLDLSADDMENLYFEQILFKVISPLDTIINAGKYEIVNISTGLKSVGKIRNGRVDGIWRTYYNSGRVESVVNYKEGKIRGNAFFYYDAPKHCLRAEIVYEDDKIINKYREYYKNGTKKAVLDYRKGKAHGKAEFYYTNGNLKIEGVFKRGRRSGKWKYYTIRGEILEKRRIRRN